MRVWRHIKKLAENLALLAWYAVMVMGLHGPVRFFCEDETRIGLKTISGRKITAKGIKPKGKVQWQFKATYLYGVVEPSTGESFFYEFTHLNSDCFQVFLDLVSEQYKDSLLIMQLDQAGAHKAKRLMLPANIILLFQPSHAPETNPIERVWQHVKLGLRWQLPQDLDALRLLMRTRLETMTQTVMASLVGWRSILDALSVAGP
jgi:transposase